MEAIELSNGLELNVDYTFDSPEPEVGYSGQVSIWKIFLNGKNVTKTLRGRLVDELQEKLEEMVYGR